MLKYFGPQEDQLVAMAPADGDPFPQTNKQILDVCSQHPQQVCSPLGRCRVIMTGTGAVPPQVTVAPLIILSPIVTRCNSPSHD